MSPAKTESSMSMKKTEKKPRKGPMAGTGHEGYGRLPFRGRKVSTISAGSLGRCASAGSATESVLETSSTRDSSVYRENKFTVNRLDVEGVNPTVTRSGYNASDGSSLLPNRLSVGYKMNSPDELSTNSSLGNDTGWSTSLPAATPGRGPSSLATIRPARSCGRSFDRGDKTTPVQPPTLAIGRPVHRAQPFHDKELPRLLTPTGELPPLSSSSINDTTRPTLPYTTPTKGFHERVEGNWEMSGKNTKPQSKPSRMFNFFQRAQKSPKHEIKPEHPAINVQVTVTHQPPSRSIAHYAMLDSDERVDLGYLERIMQDTETLRGDGVATGEESVSEKAPSLRPRERRRNGVLPSASVRHKAHTHMPRPSSPKPLLPQGEPSMNNVPAPASNLRRHDFPEASVTSSLRSRLSPVGRIPRVVSKRDRDRKLPDVSFSRPFARAQPRPIVQPPGALYTAIREAASPSEPASVTTASSDAARSYSDESSTVRHVDTKPRATNSFDGVDGVNAGTSIEFISFSPRHNSDMSYSSNSSTAIVPAAGAPLSEDEIWHEYNDLIDDVLPAGTLKPAGPSLEASSRYANLTSKRSDVRQSSALPRSDSLLSRQSSTRSTDLFSITRSSTVPAVTRTPSYGSSTLPPLALPNPSLSVIENHNDYGEPNDFGSARTSIRKSLPPVTRISSGSIRSSLHPSLRRTSGSARSRSTSVPEASSVRSSTNNAGLGVSQTYFRDTQLMNIAEIETGNDGDSMANLRLGALMTSKWLSFGRVLFSPAHVEVKSNKAERVLVVDGLGKDWSYFCALTYPEAIVYSLGPNHINEPSSLPIADQSVWHSLPNHRHVHHANVAAPFPFSRGFFAAVVFRFPLASTDAVLQTAVSECKRVLRPGGYLEVSVLDLDMLNMGNRARRAVRGLKMRMQEMDPDISLKPASDNIQKMLGRRGFENLNRCVVGVPVAGHIPGSRDMDTATTGVCDGDDNEKNNNLSFADLLKDQSSGNNDENITKMIARVGRWWYSQCHETGVLTTARNRNTSASIWADEALLRECEKRSTSFRLLISYAQKPTATMRRTVSV
ncbi:hypothetical protein LTR04_006060 [Oleoguttula sp. CCFEE 6159]|nr:hypothetical protein LTR04_006060 [Oleoguttula sp. CCFEE 6159]